jgi:hypothetical protein
MLHHVCLHGEEATDLTVRLGDEHVLVAQDDVGDEGERLLVRVDAREGRQCCPGGEEEPGDRIGILGSRWPDPQPFVHSRSMQRRISHEDVTGLALLISNPARAPLARSNRASPVPPPLSGFSA